MMQQFKCTCNALVAGSSPALPTTCSRGGSSVGRAGKTSCRGLFLSMCRTTDTAITRLNRHLYLEQTTCSVRGLFLSMCRKISAAIPSGLVPGSTSNGNPSLIRGLLWALRIPQQPLWLTAAGPVPTSQVVRFRRQCILSPSLFFSMCRRPSAAKHSCSTMHNWSANHKP